MSEGKGCKVVVVGYKGCAYFNSSSTALTRAAEDLGPKAVQVQISTVPTADQFRNWVSTEQTLDSSHTTSPLVWTEPQSDTFTKSDVLFPTPHADARYIGGCDDTAKWLKEAYNWGNGKCKPRYDTWDVKHPRNKGRIFLGKLFFTIFVILALCFTCIASMRESDKKVFRWALHLPIAATYVVLMQIRMKQ